MTSDNLPEISQARAELSQDKNLLLWDAQGLDADYLVGHLQRNDLLKEFTVILFDLAQDSHVEPTALQLGVMGFFNQNDSSARIVRCLKHIFEGNAIISPGALYQCLFGAPPKKLAQMNTALTLTKREEEMLRIMTHGYRNAEIANQLSISPNTVKTHLYQALKKIKVDSRMLAAQQVSNNLPNKAI